MEEHPAGAFRSGGAAFFFVLRHSCYARVGDGAGPLHQASSGVKEWAEKYKRARAEAERDPNILTQPAQDFERAPASQMGARLRGGSEAANAQRHSTQEDGSQAIDIKSMWAPQWLAASQSFSLPVFEDTKPSPQSMAEQMQKFRKKIDDTFGWTGKLLDDSQIAFRAAAQAILLQSGRTQERSFRVNIAQVAPCSGCWKQARRTPDPNSYNAKCSGCWQVRCIVLMAPPCLSTAMARGVWLFVG